MTGPGGNRRPGRAQQSAGRHPSPRPGSTVGKAEPVVPAWLNGRPGAAGSGICSPFNNLSDLDRDRGLPRSTI